MVFKLILEIVISIVLHPLAYILCIVNIVSRKDIGGFWKLLWILITFLWGIGPILYILLGGGELW